MVGFHEHSYRDFSNGAEGLKAVWLLRDAFEASWKDEFSGRHPFRHRIARASVDSYEWLIQYARKILTARSLPGFGVVERRFGDPDEFFAAAAEMEIALLLSLGGFEIDFLAPSNVPTPDLRVRIEGKTFGLEIGSVNPPAEQARLSEAMTRVLTYGFTKAVTGGVISRPPTDAELETIDTEVRSAVVQAADNHRIVKVSLPGLATIYVAPPDLAADLPDDCRGQFRTIPPYERPAEERIARVVRGKIRQFEALGDGGMLFLYDNALGAETVLRLFDDPGDDTGTVLASIPRLVSLGLVVPHRFRNRPVQASWTTKDLRTLLTVQIGVDEWADLLIWENRHPEQALPAALDQAIKTYDQNLDRLLPL